MANKRPPITAKNPEPSNYTYGEKGIPGTSNPINRGYAVQFPTADPASNNANGLLTDQLGRRIYFWIENVEANVTMNGSTGQSRSVRQFFPRNMIQPTFTIQGRMPDSFKFNKLAGFVRESQWLARSGRYFKMQRMRGTDIAYNNFKDSNSGDSIYDPTIQLTIAGRAPQSEWQGHYGTSFKDPVIEAGGDSNPDSGTTRKGINRGWVLKGYIQNIQAGAKRFDPAPQFQFQFLVSQMQDGAWTDESVDVAGLKTLSWMDQFANRKMNEFVALGDPNKKNDKKNNSNQGNGPLAPAAPFAPGIPNIDIFG